MAGLLSAAGAVGARSDLSVFFTHTYTRTPRVVGSDDTYGPGTTDGTPVMAVPCKYRVNERLRLEDGDRVTVSVPSIKVVHDDPLVVGDTVSNIQNSEGVVLLTGPLTVETIEAASGLGPMLSKRALLRGGDVR